ncbi:hypothetical protein Z946_3310 [Sulfitobacter noctilucicola]|uniref:Uncharacterized protein n=1 Tax=Sulfitobacter noctilucicola TaxID=1342301 RepID=A0A7W6MA10_9RHOB|nr:hypothetical protein [Sulfitobacter noctilucicola]KIN64419.1 hypothetical protein Z946_3310 [Sulfitobacter noctilucicola]MBB4174422.1 hypothetical protein [Sulfitobacter noctilucicola]
MKDFVKFVCFIVSITFLCGAVLHLFGPYDDDNLTAEFDEPQMSVSVSGYFTAQETLFEDIISGVQKRPIMSPTQTDGVIAGILSRARRL